MNNCESEYSLRQSLVTCKAPNFRAISVTPNGTEEMVELRDYLGRYVFLCFYPLAFTYVCPTEIIACSNRISEFMEYNTEVLWISGDSHFAFHQWRNMTTREGGIGPVKVPMIADQSHEIAKKYGVLLNVPEKGQALSLRATFLVDQEGIIRHQSVNDLPVGRNIDEMLRFLKAWMHYKAHGEHCPVNWHEGKAGLVPSAEGIADFLTSNAEEI